MSSKYFSNFPRITYDGVPMRNIMLKTDFVKELFQLSTAFYDYVLKEGDRPTTVAFNYYGSVDYAWLVILSNTIIDPYFEWPMTQEEFDQFIIKKYGSIQAAKSAFYEYRLLQNGKLVDFNITPTTYTYAYDNTTKGNFVGITNYDKEFELNETRRRIKLVEASFAPNIAIELKKKLS
jgi:hypothetical protein